MSDGVKPATEAQVALWRELTAKATPGPWRRGSLSGQCFMQHPHGQGACDYRAVWHDDGNGVWRDVVEQGVPLGDLQDAALVAGTWDYEEGGIRHERDAEFIAAARTAVPSLLAALGERDHLIWVLSQDQESYRRGVEEGIRKAIEVLNSQFALGPPLLLLKAVEAELGRLPPPLPPDRLRAEVERLRAGYRRILAMMPPEESPPTMGETVQSIARDALGEPDGD